MERLLSDGELTVIVLPRTPEQAEALEQQGFGSLLWQEAALDGPQLIAGADAVISAGGSISREAAVLGTPAWSFYAGRLGAVDRTLVAAGSLRLLRDADDVLRLRLRKKPPRPAAIVDDGLVVQLVDRILAVAG